LQLFCGLVLPFDYQCFVSLGGVKDAFCFSTSSRRDAAQLAVLQVGTPSFGNSHWVKTT
jgi:hypothetical protein